MKQTKPIRHGEHAGYARGCRCDGCMEAHRVYNRERMRRHRRYKQGTGPKPISRSVSPDVSERHLRWLRTKGLSINAIAEQTGIHEATLKKIRSGHSKNVWRTTEAAILLVRADNHGPNQLVKADYSKKIAQAIRDAGYTLLQINVMMGRSAHPSPLIRGEWIRIKTQKRWEELYFQLFRHPASSRFRKPENTKFYYDERKRPKKYWTKP